MAIDLGTEYVATDGLGPHPDNPRRGDLAAIGQSLERNGQYRPIVVNRPTMEVLAGNHTLLAARELGWVEIAATFVDVDSERAKRILLVDNRTNDLAGYDTEELVDLLAELGDLSGTGYDQDVLGELLDELAPDPVGEDEPPPLPEDPETRPGDLLRLGLHRLLCADAREPGSYATLIGDERAELLWTDPPYGVDYEGKTKESLRIEGDGAAGLEGLLSDSFAAADSVLSPAARLYVAHPAGALSLTFGGCFVAQGWKLRQTLVWLKDAFVLGRSDYHYRHEPILYGHKSAEGRIGRGARGWFGDHAQDSVLEVARPRASREHPTMKPPELVERCLRNSSRRGHLVLDPFAGSGSTLVACESSGRAARLLEADPRCCDDRRALRAADRPPGGAVEAMTCTAKTRDGDPCGGQALGGREVCYAHSGARVGRPSALTPDVHDRIVQAVKAGAPNWVAALSAGISETTLYDLRRGRGEETGPCRDLYEATERARGEA